MLKIYFLSSSFFNIKIYGFALGKLTMLEVFSAVWSSSPPLWEVYFLKIWEILRTRKILVGFSFLHECISALLHLFRLCFHCVPRTWIGQYATYLCKGTGLYHCKASGVVTLFTVQSQSGPTLACPQVVIGKKIEYPKDVQEHLSNFLPFSKLLYALVCTLYISQHCFSPPDKLSSFFPSRTLRSCLVLIFST